MRRLSRLLSRSSVKADNALVFQKHTPQESSVLNLPIEILLLIESYLAYEHIICFSLTCKKAYELFFHRYRPLTGCHPRKGQLLLLLERDSANLLTCPEHEILYDWRKQRGKRYRCPQCRTMGDSMVVCNKGCQVGFLGIFNAERRLMIRHSFLGPEYGISMKSLNHVCKRSKSKLPNQVTPKIAGRSLMVWRTLHYTASIDFASWKDLDLNNNFNEVVCVHTERYRLPVLLVACILRARKRRKWLLLASTPQKSYMNDLMSWQSPILFKCAQCTTDIRVRMDQISANQIDIQLDVFQDLGGLDQPSRAQSKVLGTRIPYTSECLTWSERAQRLREDLQKRYFGQNETAEKYCEGVPWNAAFLEQWRYAFSSDEERNPIHGVPDRDMPRAIWLRVQHIPFRRERDHKKT